MNADYGFNCGEFNLQTSADGYIIPCGKVGPLTPMMLGAYPIAAVPGAFTLRATSEGRIVCDVPVFVDVVTTRDDPQKPFLALRSDAFDDLIATLHPYIGKHLELAFIRRN